MIVRKKRDICAFIPKRFEDIFSFLESLST